MWWVAKRMTKMTQLEYLIPETLDEALEMLEKGVPLAGGSALAPIRKKFKSRYRLA